MLFAMRMALALGLLAAVWLPGRHPASRIVGPAQAATLGTYDFEADPTVGPAGSTVSVSGASFDTRDTQYQWQIGFDDPNTVLATIALATCSPSLTPRPIGFGTACDGQEVDVVIPPNATPGNHELLMLLDGLSRGSATFTVTESPTATNTDTPTETPTDTPSDTATDTPSATATGSDTDPPTATGTATSSWTPSASSTPSMTAPAPVVTWTPTSTPTPSSSPSPTLTATRTPIAPSAAALTISVAQLQRVQGGCSAQASPSGALAPTGQSVPNQAVANGGPLYVGGQRLNLHANHLPPNTVVDLVFSGPRATISGAVDASLDYSPPVSHARTDASGALVAGVTLPDDLAAGAGMVQVLPHVAPAGAAHPLPLATWTFQDAPRDPTVMVTVDDATGRPLRGATVSYVPASAIDASGIHLTGVCGRVSGPAGGAVFSRVPPGAGEVIATLGNRVLATANPRTLPGGTVRVRLTEVSSIACFLKQSAILGHPVVAADGPGLLAARRAVTGSWTVWQLGSDAQPQLTTGADGSVLMLAAPAGTAAPTQGPALRFLPRGGAWGDPLYPFPGEQTIDGVALAVDPRTGALHAAIQYGAASPSATLDPAMRLADIDLAPGGRLMLASQGLRLDPPAPAPGRRATLLVQVRNAGLTSLPVGSAVLVRLSPPGISSWLHLPAPLAPGASTTLRESLVTPVSGLQVTARAGADVEQAMLGLPPPPSNVGMTPRASEQALQVNWVQSVDPDIVSYRVYRGIGPDGPLSLAGIATGTLWQDAQRAPHTTYRYQVTAVDRYGRESLLSAPLIVPAS